MRGRQNKKLGKTKRQTKSKQNIKQDKKKWNQMRQNNTKIKQDKTKQKREDKTKQKSRFPSNQLKLNLNKYVHIVRPCPVSPSLLCPFLFFLFIMS